MTHRILFALGALLWLYVPAPSLAQQWVPGAQGIPIVCAYSTSPPTVASGAFVYAQCSSNGTLLGGGGGGGGGTSSNFGATFPSAGTAAGAEYLSSPPTLTSGQMVALQTDVNGNLKVAGLSGSVSNASSGVSTSSNNLGAVSWLYGFNGTTWDQLQVDGSKNLKINIATCNSSICPALGQASMASSSPVVIASNQSFPDPCVFQAKTNLPVSTNATALTQIIAANASTKIYICSLHLIPQGATAFSLVTGTGTNCGTSTTAVVGDTTAANGLGWAANGGSTEGNGGGSIAIANLAGAELCTLQSNAVRVSGNLTYIQQ